MFDWLLEGRVTVYVILAAVMVVLLFLWWQNRQRSWLISAGVVLGLAGLYLLLDWSIETTREQVERKVREMSAHVKANNLDGIFQHISKDFRYGNQTKESLRAAARRVLGHEVTEVKVWGFSDARKEDREEVAGKAFFVDFQVKPEGAAVPGGYHGRCVAQFGQDADGEWRMRSFKVFDLNSTQERNIPDFRR